MHRGCCAFEVLTPLLIRYYSQKIHDIGHSAIASSIRSSGPPEINFEPFPSKWCLKNKTTHLEGTGNETLDTAQFSSDAPLVPMRGKVHLVF